MVTLLVAGADRTDAGKTTFSVGLCAHLGATGFKPRAGNDYWFDQDDYRRAIGEGRLYGNDARRLAEASVADVSPESINPVHRLWRLAPDGDEFLGRAHRTFVPDRVGDGFVVNGDADVPASAVEALSLADAPRVSTVEELNRLTRERYLPVLDDLRRRIEAADRADGVVAEAYSEAYGALV